MNKFTELLAVLEGDHSNRSLSISGARRETIIEALHIAAAGVLPAIPHASYIEKKIVERLVTDLIAAGFSLSVNDGEEVTVERSTDIQAIFAALSSTDSDYLLVHSVPMKRDEHRWVRLIWGNDVDVISDYHTSLEPYLAGANALANEIDS